MSVGGIGSLVLAFALCLAGDFAQAAFQVTDPRQILESLRGFSQGLPFEVAFQCDSLQAFQGNVRDCRAQCTSYCMDQCARPESGKDFRFQLGVARCSKDSVTVVSDDVVPLLVPISREEYEKGANSWIIPLLTRTGYFLQPEGTAEIQNRITRFADFIENGKKRSLRVEMILGQFLYPGADMGLGFELWYAPELDGPRQILYFGMSQQDAFLQARGLIRQWP